MTARPSDFLTVREVQAILRVGRMTVYRLANSGNLPAYRIGQQIRVRRDDLEQYLRDSAVQG